MSRQGPRAGDGWSELLSRMREGEFSRQVIMEFPQERPTAQITLVKEPVTPLETRRAAWRSMLNKMPYYNAEEISTTQE